MKLIFFNKFEFISIEQKLLQTNFKTVYLRCTWNIIYFLQTKIFLQIFTHAVIRGDKSNTFMINIINILKKGIKKNLHCISRKGTRFLIQTQECSKDFHQ